VATRPEHSADLHLSGTVQPRVSVEPAHQHFNHTFTRIARPDRHITVGHRPEAVLHITKGDRKMSVDELFEGTCPILLAGPER
jgi:hypothetical protein